MKSYGKFEAVREVCQTPVAAIWTARPVGTRGAAVACIKLIQPDAPVFAGKGAAHAEEMLIAAALQQSIANKSEHWAPIYELGYDGNTAFYVTRLCERSVQRLIDLKIKVNSADLLMITSAIVEGLLDLRTAFDRAHGNLKPANVLISGKGRIRREDVRLTDPHAGEQEIASMTRSPDVKAIGEMIFALVTGRPHTTARWPVVESAEWNRLGSSGGQWWSLCNDLLNTMARQGPMPLEKLQARLSMMRLGRRRLSRGWLAVPAVLALAAAGYALRAREVQWAQSGKQWAMSLAHHPARRVSPPMQALVIPPTSRQAVAINVPEPVVVPEPVHLPDPMQPVLPPPVKPTAPPASAPTRRSKIEDRGSMGVKSTAPPASAPTVAVPPAAPVQPPVQSTAEATKPPSEPAPTPQPAPQPPAPPPLPVIQLPAFLPGTAAAKFLETISQLSTPATADRRAKFAQSVNALDAAYPVVAIHGDRPWQKELGKLVDAKRESELMIAVSALAESHPFNPSAYTKFVSAAQAFSGEATDAEDAINVGSSWSPHSNRTNIDKTLHDEQSLLEDEKARSVAAPGVLEEMYAINAAVTAGNPQGLLEILHDQSSSVPARVAAWQALDLPALHGHWPGGRADFVAAQKDGDALIAAAAGTNLNTKTAISDYQDRRLQAFYSTLTNQLAVTDAVTHLKEIEDGRGDQRPAWLEFDRILYALTNNPTTPSDADLQQLKALRTLPQAVELAAALQKAHNAAANEQPLQGIGPGLLHWTARPFNASGIQGCLYSTDSCPAVEFIRVEPGAGKGPPFYLASTDVSVGLIAAMLNDPAQSAATATESLRALCPPAQPPSPGAHVWKFASRQGIELDPDSYVQYFRQSPTLDLPMQQITPRAALYLARDLGCRLPTTAEWQAALAMAFNPPNADDPMKGFATGGWKLRDADFASLVDKAALNQRYPDEGAFLGPDPSLIPTGPAATEWTAPAVRKLGGWTVAELRDDRMAQRQMAKLDEDSSDFRADLIDVPQVGFRPVGTAHHVFHDLVGNVAQFVLDAPVSDVEQLPFGTTVNEKAISDFFTAGDHAKQLGIIGGSFLSPPELDPVTRIGLPANAVNPAYTDVGFRLAFTDPRAYADASSVIRHTGYLYPPPPPRPVDTSPSGP